MPRDIELHNPHLKPGAHLMVCSQCGAEVGLRTHVVCHNCGAELELVQRVH